MRRPASTLVFIAGLIALGLNSAGRADDEMDRHLATLRSQLSDPVLPVGRREQIALDMAGTLDRAARTAATPDEKRRRWAEAIALLEAFDKDNPGHPQARQFQLQAAVFRWARGKLWAEQAALSPTATEPRAQAVQSFDEAIAALQGVKKANPAGADVLAQNVRFRLAQTLVDRADLDADGSTEKTARLREASDVLATAVTEPALQGFARLLRAAVLAELGEADAALPVLESAAKALPPPPDDEILQGRIAVLTAARRFDDALRAIDAAGKSVSAPLKGLLTVRVRLAERRSMAPGSARHEAETALFRAIQPLRGSPAPEARLALLALGRGVVEPDPTQDPEAWDALAEAALTLGQLERASTLEAGGADRADALNKREQAAALRLRAGAALFQAGKFLDADALLAKVAADPQGGPARPKAALLRALASGRALALKMQGASPTAYVAALETLIKNFPADVEANEGRWLLGRLRMARGDRAGAQKLWADIARTDPRWLEARLAVADIRREELETQQINNDRELVRQRYNEARSFLAQTFDQCRTDVERASVDLARARLELTAEVGNAEEARKLCEVVQRSASLEPQRDAARRLHIAAVANLNHFIEAEREARDEVGRSGTADLLDTARLLDKIASESTSDLRMRRFGLVLRILLRAVIDREDELPAEDRAEARLREIRALLFSGDDARARNALTSGFTPSMNLSDRLLKDLADTYVRVEAFELATTVQRLRSQRAKPGSLPWFEARYGLALALYRSGKPRDAAKLIDATAILHPELGGGDLRDKFIHLRQRLSTDE